MDINKTLMKLKQEPGFTDNVGMMLVHNGVVRGWSRKDHAPLVRLPNQRQKSALPPTLQHIDGIAAARINKIRLFELRAQLLQIRFAVMHERDVRFHVEQARIHLMKGIVIGHTVVTRRRQKQPAGTAGPRELFGFGGEIAIYLPRFARFQLPPADT